MAIRRLLEEFRRDEDYFSFGLEMIHLLSWAPDISIFWIVLFLCTFSFIFLEAHISRNYSLHTYSSDALLCSPLNCVTFPQVLFCKGDQNSSHLGEKTFAVNHKPETHQFRTVIVYQGTLFWLTPTLSSLPWTQCSAPNTKVCSRAAEWTHGECQSPGLFR